MARIESMTISQFMNPNYNTEKILDPLIRFLDKHKVVFRVVGVTLIIFSSGLLDTSVFAATGIDEGATKIYEKLINVGKWVIIIKGGWETINNTIKGDFDTAKKSFLQYLIIYVILLAFPWAMSEVDVLFRDI
jgi:hypothetical protein